MTTSSSSRQAGFGAIAIIIVIVVIALAAVAGVVVYKRSSDKNNNVNTTANPPAAQPMASPQQQPVANPYEGMTRYTNEKYGISFYYPTEWTVSEVAVPSNSGSPAPVEFSVGLKVNKEEKYNDTVVIEIFSKTYTYMVDHYNKYFSQSADAQITKDSGVVQGKQSTHYKVTYPSTQPVSSRSERQLFAVGDKTFSLRSINEELNIQRDSVYWDKFAKVRGSLQLR